MMVNLSGVTACLLLEITFKLINDHELNMILKKALMIENMCLTFLIKSVTFSVNVEKCNQCFLTRIARGL